ncbi:MAG: tyrosinase family protein [Myxococcota bacterium]
MKVQTTPVAAQALTELGRQIEVNPKQARALQKNAAQIDSLGVGTSHAELVGLLTQSKAFKKSEAEAVVSKLERILAGLGTTPNQAVAGALKTLSGAGASETHEYMFNLPGGMAMLNKALSTTMTVPAGNAATSVSLKLHTMGITPAKLSVTLTPPAPAKPVKLTPDQCAQLSGDKEVAFELPALAGAAPGGKWKLSVSASDKKGMVHMAMLDIVSPGGSPPVYTAPKHYEDMSAAQLTKLAKLHDAFMSPAHLKEHSAWHEVNGSGGTRGPGSGELFLLFHHQMMTMFSDYCAQNGGKELLTEGKVPIWDPTKAIPAQVKNTKATRDNSNPNIPMPQWLLLKGEKATAAGQKRWGATATGDITGIKSLDDVKTLDDLGRLMGTSGYHGSAHNEIGGTMATFGSPQDPIFFGWHGHIDDIMLKWAFKTANGQKWMSDPANAAKLNNFKMPAKVTKGMDLAIQKGIDLNEKIDFTDAVARKALGLKPLHE